MREDFEALSVAPWLQRAKEPSFRFRGKGFSAGEPALKFENDGFRIELPKPNELQNHNHDHHDPNDVEY